MLILTCNVLRCTGAPVVPPAAPAEGAPAVPPAEGKGNHKPHTSLLTYI